ncbi:MULTISPECIES: L,D-transpeptidase [Streptomyces]|uniref:L,D-transpeptidase n=1 Tax=Streptomyces griseiscabiei TaxID=2993540 RepID=A0ABU4LD34_9ACTN|nr:MULTISPECIES: L,D-transpeptidase [Streptomyces]MBZ3907420.1 L,D-transpeptidase [Streptomyces griseiscabiei]MDX2913513.1 L,D-transpeptidase [Streptomyces griseiscabiei]
MASSSSVVVAGLTAAAIAAVGFLTYQASANAPDDLGKPSASESPKAKQSKTPAEREKDTEDVLPEDSGTGERVVYSLDDDRVWLVGANEKVTRTFEVTPSTVDPTPATYTVSSRSAAVTGSDGTPIENVVRFASVDGISVGFSAAVDGSTPEPDPATKTGGIRESRKDGKAMWEFAGIGTKVVVVE